jgi:hypothetical protein
MLYIATVHYSSPRWIEIQAAYLRRHIRVPYQTWSSLELIDPSYSVHFDRTVEQFGPHAGKLNHLAREISQEAADEDLLMFLDGDAFPIADPMPLIDESLARGALLAVRRAENFNELQPHPCFCVTTVRTWRALRGDWCAGPTWPGARGKLTSDVGAILMRRLEVTHTPWVDLLRSNRKNLDPLYFGVYGEVIYHHGAGFRGGEMSGVHRALAPARLAGSELPVLGSALELVNRARWRRWEASTQRRHLRQSQLIYEKIRRGDPDWLADVM